jgi:hypothetical protein
MLLLAHVSLIVELVLRLVFSPGEVFVSWSIQLYIHLVRMLSEKFENIDRHSLDQLNLCNLLQFSMLQQPHREHASEKIFE